MSESKMTPGPWTAVDHSWSHTGIYGADGRQIALINIEPEATEETQADLEAVAAANARAIAAVPELIAACRMVSMLRQLGGMLPGVKEVIDVAVQEADAALTKALGQ